MKLFKSKKTARFAFWWVPGNGYEPFPIFTLHDPGDKAYDGSSVEITTLRKLKVEIPPYPTFESWLRAGGMAQFRRPIFLNDETRAARNWTVI